MRTKELRNCAYYLETYQVVQLSRYQGPVARKDTFERLTYGRHWRLHSIYISFSCVLHKNRSNITTLELLDLDSYIITDLKN